MELSPEADPERSELLVACGRARFFADGAGTELLIAAVYRSEAGGDRERAAGSTVERTRLMIWRGDRDAR